MRMKRVFFSDTSITKLSTALVPGITKAGGFFTPKVLENPVKFFTPPLGE